LIPQLDGRHEYLPDPVKRIRGQIAFLEARSLVGSRIILAVIGAKQIKTDRARADCPGAAIRRRAAHQQANFDGNDLFPVGFPVFFFSRDGR